MAAPGSTTLLLLVAVTAILFLVVAVAGKRRQRALHYAGLFVALPMFAFTVFEAESLGRQIICQPLPFHVHMTFAYLATLSLTATVVTGLVRMGRAPIFVVRAHRVAVMSFLITLVGAALTGAWMLSTSIPLPANTPAMPLH